MTRYQIGEEKESISVMSSFSFQLPHLRHHLKQRDRKYVLMKMDRWTQ